MEDGIDAEEAAILNLTLEDPYEDDDFKIYFSKQSLLHHLNHLEDDNLFKIHLVQEDEQILDQTQRNQKKRFDEV